MVYGGIVMKKGLSRFVALGCAALAFLTLTSVCNAQIGIRVGRGGGIYPGGGYYGGSPYYGGGYGYGPYYGAGRGVGVNIGGYPGYGGYGYGSPGYGVRYGTQPGVINTGPLTTQSFYPPANGPVAPNVGMPSPNDGRARVVVTVPANAQVFWNGSPSTLTGSTRYYTTLPLTPEGAMQRFEARWMGQDGQPVSQIRDIRAMPNATVTVDFTRPEAEGKAPLSN